MKAKEVLKLLQITRTTLYNYTKTGLIKVKNEINGRYDYDEDSVYSLLNKNKERLFVIYCRVSTTEQKNSLDTQIESINNYCLKNGIMVNKVYKDIDSGMTLDRKGLNELFEDISSYKVDTVYITNKDRITRLSFKMIETIFMKYGTKIVPIFDNDCNNDEKELLYDIMSLIHCFSMKNYSNRRKKKLSLISEDLSLELDYKQ